MNSVTSSPHLLVIDASPRGDRSHSRKLGEEFLALWRAAHPEGRAVVRDIGRTPPPFLTEAWVEGAFTPAAEHSPAARDAIAASNAYVDELLAADQIVITTPMHNLSFPAALKAWIDQIVRVGRTFAKTADGFAGLAAHKRVLVIVASGSDYRPGTPGGAYNFIESYLRTILGFIGIADIRFIYAHSLNGDAREQVLAEARAALLELAA
ncbi:MAG TPA: NAD(P)H-dependent oxidoreductase [Opitutus sp.]|nr:NAD(P)H-dependent oxidoreductase [Opitutus sp.]